VQKLPIKGFSEAIIFQVMVVLGQRVGESSRSAGQSAKPTERNGSRYTRSEDEGTVHLKI
jgi:hypothetical protein